MGKALLVTKGHKALPSRSPVFRQGDVSQGDGRCAHASAIETTANGAAKGRPHGGRKDSLRFPNRSSGLAGSHRSGASAAKREVNIFRLGRTSETSSSA